MSDAACEHNQLGRKNFVEEHWRKGIILVQIWRELLRVIFAGELGGLNESKREMWILLVAAGSGYLARCWHRSLKPKSLLTDYPHVDPQDPREVKPESNSSESPPLIVKESLNSTLRKSPSALGNELAPKPLKRNFSPKALGKKLFSSEASKSAKAARKEAEARSSAEASNKLVEAGVEKSQDATVGHSSRRSPWSSFRSRASRDSSSEETSRESSGCLKRTGDAFRKSRERRKSENGSASSRSILSHLGEGDNGSPSAGSSRREMDGADSLYSSSGLTVRSLSGAFSVAELSDLPGSGELPEVASSQLRPKLVENEAKPTVSSAPERPSIRKDLMGSANGVNYNNSAIRGDGPSSVAHVVSHLETGNVSVKAETVNAVLSLRVANQAQAQAQAQAEAQVAVTDQVNAQTLEPGRIEHGSVAEAEKFPGGKGKRRADAGKLGEDGEGQAVPAVLTGKRTKDSKDSNEPMALESVEVTLTSFTSKRVKDLSKSKEDAGDAEEPSSTIGAVDLSEVFFGFDNAFFSSPTEEKSPFKFYKRSRYLNRSGSRGIMRKMRESPRPVSALESCLQAQFPLKDEGSRVARSLNFSSLVSQKSQRRESLEPGVEIPSLKGDPFSAMSLASGAGFVRSAQQSPPTEGVIGLPLLKSPPSKWSANRVGGQRGQYSVDSASNYPRKVVLEERGRVVSSQTTLNDVLWRSTPLPMALKKRKVSQACSPSATSVNMKTKGYELEALVIPPMEGLLFSFGVGIGVMSLIDGSDDKFVRLSKELHQSKEQIESLKDLLRLAREQASGSSPKQEMVGGRLTPQGETGEMRSSNKAVSDGPALVPDVDEIGREMFDLYRREAPETPQQTEHMAELEAELEAELDALTSGITESSSAAPDFGELDPEGVAGVADRDLGVEGLPASLDWDDDNDDFITEEPAHVVGGVPPRELSRLLRKVQNSRQECRIAELEADLQEALVKLQIMERELTLLKERTMSFALPSAGKDLENSGPVAKDVSERLIHSDNRSVGAKIELGNQNVFEDQDEDCIFLHKSGTVTDVSEETKECDELILITPVKHRPGSGLRKSVASVPGSRLVRSVSSDPPPAFSGSVGGDPVSDGLALVGSDPFSSLRSSVASELVHSPRVSAASVPGCILRDLLPIELGSNLSEAGGSEAGSNVQEPVASMVLSEGSDSEAQADNDAICDEFLSSVFGSPEDGQAGVSSVSKSSLDSPLYMPGSPTQGVGRAGKDSPVISTDLNDVNLHSATTTVGEDLDKVVGELLKRDSSSVKNAINAFLRWEAETPAIETRRDMFRAESPVFGSVDTDFQALLDTRRELRYTSSKVQLTLSGTSQERDSGSYFRQREDSTAAFLKKREDSSRAGTNSPIGRLPKKSAFQSPKLRSSRMGLENRLYQNPTSDWLAEVGSPPDTQ